MGAANYYVSEQPFLNVGLDQNFPERFQDEQDMQESMAAMCEALDLFIDSLPKCYFYRIVTEPGYHFGFQAYIVPNFSNLGKYAAYRAKELEKYHSFTDVNGYETDIEACPYIRKGLTRINAETIQLAMQREYRQLHNLLLAEAKKIGLASLSYEAPLRHEAYPIPLKPLSLGQAQQLLGQIYPVVQAA